MTKMQAVAAVKSSHATLLFQSTVPSSSSYNAYQTRATSCRQNYHTQQMPRNPWPSMNSRCVSLNTDIIDSASIVVSYPLRTTGPQEPVRKGAGSETCDDADEIQLWYVFVSLSAAFADGHPAQHGEWSSRRRGNCRWRVSSFFKVCLLLIYIDCTV